MYNNSFIEHACLIKILNNGSRNVLYTTEYFFKIKLMWNYNAKIQEENSESNQMCHKEIQTTVQHKPL